MPLPAADMLDHREGSSWLVRHFVSPKFVKKLKHVMTPRELSTVELDPKAK